MALRMAAEIVIEAGKTLPMLAGELLGEGFELRIRKARSVVIRFFAGEEFVLHLV